jgi:hypothetical protein
MKYNADPSELTKQWGIKISNPTCVNRNETEDIHQSYILRSLLYPNNKMPTIDNTQNMQPRRIPKKANSFLKYKVKRFSRPIQGI